MIFFVWKNYFLSTIRTNIWWRSTLLAFWNFLVFYRLLKYQKLMNYDCCILTAKWLLFSTIYFNFSWQKTYYTPSFCQLLFYPFRALCIPCCLKRIKDCTNRFEIICSWYFMTYLPWGLTLEARQEIGHGTSMEICLK